MSVSIPSNRGGVSYRGGIFHRRLAAPGLNPLESGRCFLPKGLSSPARSLGYVSIPSNRGGVSYLFADPSRCDALLSSQSPRIGAVFPTYVEWGNMDEHERVSIPSNRGGVSYAAEALHALSNGERLNPLESGRCFLLTSTRITDVHVQLSQSPRIGAVFPTDTYTCAMSVSTMVSIPSNRGGVSYKLILNEPYFTWISLNPLESGRCFLHTC